MTYQEYFLYSNFNDIWAVLYQFYQEDARLKPLYASLVDTIKQLPIDNNQAKFTIKMRLDSYDEIIVDGAPDPQEWLVGREVEVDLSSWKDIFARHRNMDGYKKRQRIRKSDIPTLAAHLIYWSTLYSFNTIDQHATEFQSWLDQLENGNIHYLHEEDYCAASRQRKHLKYWRDTIAKDSAINWSANLIILKKKLEFNIGYWRYIQRHVSWQNDVSRMLLCCALIDISTNDPNISKQPYVNHRNAHRFDSSFDSLELTRYHLGKLRREKAFHLIWQLLSLHMKDWWD